MNHEIIPMICVPYVGARVIISDNSDEAENYKTQSSGGAGSIVSVETDIENVFYKHKHGQYRIKVTWDNGSSNSYRINDVEYTTPVDTAVIIRNDSNKQIVTGEKVKSAMQYAMKQMILGEKRYQTLEIISEHVFLQQVNDFIDKYEAQMTVHAHAPSLEPLYTKALAYLDKVRQSSTEPS